MQYKGKNRIHWKLQSGEDHYVGLVMHNTRKTPEEPNKHVSEFLVDHTSPGEIPPGEILNRWIQTVTVTYRLSIKSTLPTSATFVLFIFRQCVESFARNLAKLLNNIIHSWPQSFVEIYLKLTRPDNDNFSLLRATRRAGYSCKRTVPGSWRMSGTQTLQILTRWTK